MFAQKPLPWYLVSKDSFGVQLWQSILAIETLVETFGVPMTIAVDSFYQIDPPRWVWIAYSIAILVQLVNMVICFLKVRDPNEDHTLWNTAKPYLKQKFFFDFVGTFGSVFFFLYGN